MNTSPKPEFSDWFPHDVVSGADTAQLATIAMHMSRGFSRDAYACALAVQVEALCGVDPQHELSPDVKRFVSERLIAVGVVLSGGAN